MSSTELYLGDYIVQRRHVRYITVARGNWVLSLPDSRVIFAVARRWVEGKVQCGCCKHRDAAARRPAALSPESSGTWKSHSCPRSGSLRTAGHAISAIPLDGGGGKGRGKQSFTVCHQRQSRHMTQPLVNVVWVGIVKHPCQDYVDFLGVMHCREY